MTAPLWRIAWSHEGEESHGDPHPDRATVEEWVRAANRLYPEVAHRVEAVRSSPPSCSCPEER